MINSNFLKTVIFSSLILSPSFSVAENLVGLSYTANAKGKKIESYQFNDTDILKLDYFKLNHEGKNWGIIFPLVQVLTMGTSITTIH